MDCDRIKRRKRGRGRAAQVKYRLVCYGPCFAVETTENSGVKRLLVHHWPSIKRNRGTCIWTEFGSCKSFN